ncbi:uncharacterized protein LOC125192997 [Salvia hispanica]|uniref:uncharacterized protein LOC125192997 n=1 Tax=Salvia hispanica TaxID=49212 RepID=UPI002009286B|nr:uncharacterized protein LOC125192997 [Salvia hispanica]
MSHEAIGVAAPETMVRRLFGVFSTSKIKCHKCKYLKKTKVENLGLQLTLAKGSSLKEALEQYIVSTASSGLKFWNSINIYNCFEWLWNRGSRGLELEISNPSGPRPETKWVGPAHWT